MVIQTNTNFSVKEIMTLNVISVDPDATLQHVSELMASQKIGSIVIIDNNNPLVLLLIEILLLKLCLMATLHKQKFQM